VEGLAAGAGGFIFQRNGIQREALRRVGFVGPLWSGAIFAIANPSSLCSLLRVMANPTNVLSSGIEITGSIRFSNDMIIDGKIDGEISSDKGRVTIGENAVIKGDVTAGEVKVYGKVEGKITSERCELKDKSKINGDIKSKVFSMEEGAQLSGRTDIGG
jgi:cytoskeletal protein CcmA (bactofilin family)